MKLSGECGSLEKLVKSYILMQSETVELFQLVIIIIIPYHLYLYHLYLLIPTYTTYTPPYTTYDTCIYVSCSIGAYTYEWWCICGRDTYIPLIYHSVISIMYQSMYHVSVSYEWCI